MRLLLIPLLIAVGVCLVMFAATRDKRYLRLAWQIFRFALWAVLVFAALVTMGRIVLYGL